MTTLPGSESPAPSGFQKLGETPPDKQLQVHVVVKIPPGVPSLEETAAQVVQERKPWSREQYLQHYTTREEDVVALRRFAQAHGLRIVRERPAWRVVTLEGTAQALGAAFGVSLTEYCRQEAHYRGHDEPITLPPEIEDKVQCIFGFKKLDVLPDTDKDTARTLVSKSPRTLSQRDASVLKAGAQGPWTRYTPPEFARFYGFPEQFQGRGVCVGVLGLAGGFQQTDMDTFFRSLGMQVPPIRVVGTQRPGVTPWADFEVTMDLQIVGSCAPAARHVLYASGEASYNDISAWTYYQLFLMALFDLENRPSVLTLSPVVPEGFPGFWSELEMRTLNEQLAGAAILGISICIASGDSGSFFPMSQGMLDAPSVAYFPTSSPWVLGCGGTTLDIQDGQVVDEVVWNRLNSNMVVAGMPELSNLGSSSGGVSSYFVRPAWQARANVPAYTRYDFTNWQFSDFFSFEGRGVPDVAANSDLFVGYTFILYGEERFGGGTSAAAPLTAALLTRMCEGVGQSLGFINPLLYRLQLEDEKTAVCRTIIKGSNGGYAAAPRERWNPCTGLGSLQGQALLTQLLRVYGLGAQR